MSASLGVDMAYLVTRALSPDYFSLITPARWYSSNILMGNFPLEFLSDRRICYLHDFTNANEIFPTVEIKSGVSYFLWYKKHNDVCTIDSTISRKTERSKRYLLSEYDDIFIRYNFSIYVSLCSTESSNGTNLVAGCSRN